ncbi:ryncolin-1-like [Littorina saxatilis]|uniref:Fibrinogen C-terminal domain-containing protein n=1 Tax=Littorina saxatilis TaxID=31220 RepID=A0AAN9AQ57_9CAEN
MKVSIILHVLCVTAVIASYDVTMDLDAGLTGTCTCTCVSNKPKDCVEAQRYSNQSGVVMIYPNGDNTPLRVYCDHDTDGGGWLVFQRRQDGSVDFYRDFAEYQNGFGDVEGEFWLGLDTLHALTTLKNQVMRVDMTQWNGTNIFATYSDFSVSDSCNQFKLKYDNMTDGNVARDSLSLANGVTFSTKDEGKVSCATSYHGGWWYGMNCGDSNLNGLYKDSKQWGWDGIFWYSVDRFYSLKGSEMKIRPAS